MSDIETAAPAEQRLIAAGFGGQGVLTLGKLICRAAMRDGKNVTYMPSYGSEVRGGTANCHVVLSPETICSPLVEQADAMIILNSMSFERFAGDLKPNGFMVLNTSLVDPGDFASKRDAVVLGLPATDIASELGNIRVANVMMMGAFTEATGAVSPQAAEAAIRDWFAHGKADVVELNVAAFRRGMELTAAH